MKELVALKKNHSKPKRQTWYGVTYKQTCKIRDIHAMIHKPRKVK